MKNHVLIILASLAMFAACDKTSHQGQVTRYLGTAQAPTYAGGAFDINSVQDPAGCLSVAKLHDLLNDPANAGNVAVVSTYDFDLSTGSQLGRQFKPIKADATAKAIKANLVLGSTFNGRYAPIYMQANWNALVTQDANGNPGLSLGGVNPFDATQNGCNNGSTPITRATPAPLPSTTPGIPPDPPSTGGSVNLRGSTTPTQINASTKSYITFQDGQTVREYEVRPYGIVISIYSPLNPSPLTMCKVTQNYWVKQSYLISMGNNVGLLQFAGAYLDVLTSYVTPMTKQKFATSVGVFPVDYKNSVDDIKANRGIKDLTPNCPN